jgi:hypothetical protein
MHLLSHLITSTRCFVQAIVALKKGAHILKCGKRGKPKFCAFRLSSVSNLVPAISHQEILEPTGDTPAGVHDFSSFFFFFFLFTQLLVY